MCNTSLRSAPGRTWYHQVSASSKLARPPSPPKPLPSTQAGFCRGRSTTDQVTLLSNNIEAAFECNQKIGVILVDLTAAYGTVWLRGLHLKVLQMIANGHMASFLMELLSNRSFKVSHLEESAMVCHRAPHSLQCCSIHTSVTSCKKYRLSTVTLTTWHYYLPTRPGRQWS